MAQASPASTKRNWQNATQLGVVEWCLGARCVPKRCLHWKKTYNQISEQPLQKRTAIVHIGTF